MYKHSSWTFNANNDFSLFIDLAWDTELQTVRCDIFLSGASYRVASRSAVISIQRNADKSIWMVDAGGYAGNRTIKSACEEWGSAQLSDVAKVMKALRDGREVVRI